MPLLIFCASVSPVILTSYVGSVDSITGGFTHCKILLLSYFWQTGPFPSLPSILTIPVMVLQMPSAKMVGYLEGFCNMLAAPCRTVMYELFIESEQIG